MARICEFGTAPAQKAIGFVGIGTIRGTDDAVLKQFFGSEVNLVRGGSVGKDQYEFFVMVKDASALNADAARGKYMIANAEWFRGEEHTYVAIQVPQGADLSCRATRENAIDAMILSKQQIQSEQLEPTELPCEHA